MKNYYYKTVLILIILFASSNAISQDCNAYYFLTNGNEYELTSYNSKDKINGKTINKITNVTTNKEKTTAVIETITKDKNDKVESTATSNLECSGSTMFIELRSFIPPQSTGTFQDLEIKSDASWITLPQLLTVGMSLDDATGTIRIYSKGVLFTTMTIHVSNRKVIGKDTVTTTAGTFECYKISQDFEMISQTMGISYPVQIKSIEYHAAGAGSVKTESYNKEGVLMGYTLLTKMTKL